MFDPNLTVEDAQIRLEEAVESLIELTPDVIRGAFPALAAHIEVVLYGVRRAQDDDDDAPDASDIERFYQDQVRQVAEATQESNEGE